MRTTRLFACPCSLYEGKSVSQAQCGVCGSTRGREEVVYSVDVPVKGYPNMVSSLIASTEFEAMTGPNAINCDTCGVKRDSKLGRKLRLLPPILVVNLQRIVFDMEKLDRVKVTDRFEFPLVLDMAPFMENGVLDVLRGTSDGVGGGVEGPLPAQVISDVTSGMIWLSDLTTEAGRESARAKSEALNSRSDLNNVSPTVRRPQL